jgi:hypothetical protein
MAYIGKQPTIGAYKVLDSITTSATDTFALTSGGNAYYPASANHCIVSLNGVIQAPISSFTISGSNIVFASALTTSDVIDFIQVLGDVLNIGTPSDGTVGIAKLSATGTPSSSTFLRGDNSWQSAGGTNTPNFYATRSTAQSIPNATVTTLVYTNETFDSDSLYDASTGRFTVTASTTGYYYFYATWRTNNWTTARQAIILQKNGSDVIWHETGNVGPYGSMATSMIVNLASNGDYVEAKAYHEFGSAKDFGVGNNIGNFYGFKLI